MANFSQKIMGLTIDLGIADGDEMNTQIAAEYLNEKWMKVKAQNFDSTDSTQICILTALEIADEMMKIKNLQENIIGKCEKKLKELIKQLEDVHRVI
jgi:cell division protein ZapA (FtsZ GTPase activity inhibitor)